MGNVRASACLLALGLTLFVAQPAAAAMWVRIDQKPLADARQSRDESGPTVFGVNPVDTESVTHLSNRAE